MGLVLTTEEISLLEWESNKEKGSDLPKSSIIWGGGDQLVTSNNTLAGGFGIT
jgi:hypothetical protein